MHDGRVQAGFNTLVEEYGLRTWRAAGLRPKDTLDRPSVVCTAG